MLRNKMLEDEIQGVKEREELMVKKDKTLKNKQKRQDKRDKSLKQRETALKDREQSLDEREKMLKQTEKVNFLDSKITTQSRIEFKLLSWYAICMGWIWKRHDVKGDLSQSDLLLNLLGFYNYSIRLYNLSSTTHYGKKIAIFVICFLLHLREWNKYHSLGYFF